MLKTTVVKGIRCYVLKSETTSIYSIMSIDVPNRRCNEMPWLTMMCRKRFCRLGCVCESLNAMKSPLQHCKHVDCMILCTCENPCGTSEPECVSDVAQIPSRKFCLLMINLITNVLIKTFFRSRIPI